MGANLGFHGESPESTLSKALLALAAMPLRITGLSRFFRTPAFPPGSGPDFVNAAVAVATDLAPDDLLARLHAVEAQFARRRDARWGARTLDLDLLLIDGLVLPDAATQMRWRGLDPDRQRHEAPDRLILPHPRLQDRAFVLIPLAEIAPDWRHPVTGRTVRTMAGALSPAEIAEIRPL